MNKISRRALLGATALIPAAVLAGCSNGVVVAQYVAAIRAVGQEAVNIVPELTAAGIKVPSQVAQYATDIVNVAGGIGSAATATQGASTLNTIEGYINALAPILVPILSAAVPGAGAAIGLIVAAIPAIEALINVAAAQIQGLTAQAQTLAKDAPTPPVSLRFGARAASAAQAQPYLNLLLERHPS